jgi:hypothetical protein
MYDSFVSCLYAMTGFPIFKPQIYFQYDKVHPQFQTKNLSNARCQWLTPISLRRQTSGRSLFKASLGKIVCEIQSWKKNHKKRASGVTKGIGPEIKPQYHTQKKSFHPPQVDLTPSCAIFSVKSPY